MHIVYCELADPIYRAKYKVNGLRCVSTSRDAFVVQ